MPDCVSCFVEGTWGREVLVQGELAYHRVEQARPMKPISVKLEEFAMLWPKMDLVRSFSLSWFAL